MKAIVQHACATEATYALAEMERLNAEALAALTGQHGVKLRMFPTDLVTAARKQATDVLGDLAGKNAAARKVHDSYVAVPRAHRGLVAHLDQGGAGGAGGVGAGRSAPDRESEFSRELTRIHLRWNKAPDARRIRRVSRARALAASAIASHLELHHLLPLLAQAVDAERDHVAGLEVLAAASCRDRRRAACR